VGYRIVKQLRAVPASAALKLALSALVVLLFTTPAQGTLVSLLGAASSESGNFPPATNAMISPAPDARDISTWTARNRPIVRLGARNPYGLPAHDGFCYLDLRGDYGAAPRGGVAHTGGLDHACVTPVPELSTWFTGAGALAILLCFAWSVHSPGSGVIRIGKRD
jgi:hypothetical protein